MHQSKLVFSKIMTYLPLTAFQRDLAKHRGDHEFKDFTHLSQILAMAFARLTYRKAFRAIEVNLYALAKRLHRLRFRCATLSPNTLTKANATRSCQIYADYAQHPIGIARPLYTDEPKVST